MILYQKGGTIDHDEIYKYNQYIQSKSPKVSRQVEGLLVPQDKSDAEIFIPGIVSMVSNITPNAYNSIRTFLPRGDRAAHRMRRDVNEAMNRPLEHTLRGPTINTFIKPTFSILDYLHEKVQRGLDHITK